MGVEADCRARDWNGSVERRQRSVHPLLDRVARPNGVRNAGRELRLLLRELGNLCEPPLLGYLL